jgi:hypothetical protein
MYEPMIDCLEAICVVETFWDSKTVSEAYGLLKRITDPTFMVCLQTVLHMFGYIRGLSIKLQGTTKDIVQGYNMVAHVKSVLSTARVDDRDFDQVFAQVTLMANKANVTSLDLPRQCKRQMHRNNVPAQTP